MDRREKQAVGSGKVMAFAKPSVGGERSGGCGKQDGGRRKMCDTCSPAVSYRSGSAWRTLPGR